jgi:hypothetical protein
MNVGGAGITLSMIYAGLAGGVIGIILSGGNISELKPNTQIMEEFIIPISAFAAIFVIGLIAGGLTFLSSVAVHRNQNMFRDKLKQNNNRLFLLREGVFSLAFTSLLLLSSCLFMSLCLGHVYAQIEIGSVSSNNYNTFSLYKNTQYNFDIQYPSNWQKIEFTQGIERGGRNTVVNFLSPSEGAADKFREYFIVELEDLRPQQGFAMSSRSSLSLLTEYVNHQISDYKKLYQGFQLTESPSSSLLNKTDNNSSPDDDSQSYKIVYTYDDTTAGKIKIMELYLLKNNKIYSLSFHSEASNYSKYLPTIQKIVDSVHIA